MSSTTINTTTSTTIRAGRVFENAKLTLKAFFQSKVEKASLMYDLYGERREMRNLSDEMLRDMGITRDDLNHECSRGVTDIPANRSR